MKPFTLILLALGAVAGLVWWWRRSYVPSPLDVHYADLEAKAATGQLAQRAAVGATVPLAMMGEGWATTIRASATNPTANLPGSTRFNFNFAQPTN
jgi:hypothetical protein